MTVQSKGNSWNEICPVCRTMRNQHTFGEIRACIIAEYLVPNGESND